MDGLVNDKEFFDSVYQLFLNFTSKAVLICFGAILSAVVVGYFGKLIISKIRDV